MCEVLDTMPLLTRQRAHEQKPAIPNERTPLSSWRTTYYGQHLVEDNDSALSMSSFDEDYGLYCPKQFATPYTSLRSTTGATRSRSKLLARDSDHRSLSSQVYVDVDLDFDFDFDVEKQGERGGQSHMRLERLVFFTAIFVLVFLVGVFGFSIVEFVGV